MDIQAFTRTGLPRRLQVNQLRWGAIAAGLVMALAVSLVFALLAEVLRVSGAPLLNGIWRILAFSATAWVGGYVAGRVSGLARRADGLLHGGVTWGSLTLIALVLAAAAPAPLHLFGPLATSLTATPEGAPMPVAWWLLGALLLSLAASLWGAMVGVRWAAERETGEHDRERQLRA